MKIMDVIFYTNISFLLKCLATLVVVSGQSQAERCLGKKEMYFMRITEHGGKFKINREECFVVFLEYDVRNVNISIS